MSKAYIVTADPTNNSYTVSVPGYSTDFNAQCVTVDQLTAGSEVEIVDLNNKPPSEAYQYGNIRLLPNTGEFSYTPDGKTWKKTEELKDSRKASLMTEYVFSCNRNPIWQKERPLYRRGTVTVVNSLTSMTVKIEDGDKGNPTIVATVQYPNYTVAQAFGVGDVVVVKFEEGQWESPIIVGYWDDPDIAFDTRVRFNLTANPSSLYYEDELVIYNQSEFNGVINNSWDMYTRCPSFPWFPGPPYGWMTGGIIKTYWYMYLYATGNLTYSERSIRFRAERYTVSGLDSIVSFASVYHPKSFFDSVLATLYKVGDVYKLYVNNVYECTSPTTDIELYPNESIELTSPLYNDLDLRGNGNEYIHWPPCGLNDTFYYTNPNTPPSPGYAINFYYNSIVENLEYVRRRLIGTV